MAPLSQSSGDTIWAGHSAAASAKRYNVLEMIDSAKRRAEIYKVDNTVFELVRVGA